MRLAIPGGTTCSMHGSATKKARKAGLRRLAREQLERQVWALVDELDLPDDVGTDPGDVLTAATQRAATMASVLWVVVQQLGVAEDVDVLYSPDERVLRSLAGGGGGTVKKMAALFGPDHHGDGAPHVATEMLRKWNLQAAQLAKMELDAGVDERRLELATKIAHAQGRQLAEVLERMIELALELAMATATGAGDRQALRSAWSTYKGPIVRHSIGLVADLRDRDGEPVPCPPRPAFPVRVVESIDVTPSPPLPLAPDPDPEDQGDELVSTDVERAVEAMPSLIPPASATPPVAVASSVRRMVPGEIVDNDEDPDDAAFVAQVNAAEAARRQAMRDDLEDGRRRGGR